MILFDPIFIQPCLYLISKFYTYIRMFVYGLKLGLKFLYIILLLGYGFIASTATRFLCAERLLPSKSSNNVLLS